jgi:hypothetical protein
MIVLPFLLAIPSSDSLSDHRIHDFGHGFSCFFFDAVELRYQLLCDFGAVHLDHLLSGWLK